MKAAKVICSVLVLGATLILPINSMAKTAKVAVSQIVEHPALDSARQGLLDGLKAKGYIQGKNLDFDYKTAQGNPAIAVQIARQYVGEKPDVLVGIATPTAQALVAATRTIPVVFTAVTDPVGAKLVKSMIQLGKNVTGLSDLSPVNQQLRNQIFSMHQRIIRSLVRLKVCWLQQIRPIHQYLVVRLPMWIKALLRV